ncbi:UGSC family (seleno)protein [Microbacterium marinilacus]|uniref:UGSC family (Seleno)protein n=2 Tax=Microbacterium marinilacus TaxID=415209 RepID=A0ABP7BIP6_9MICO|nr:UGSC family (seleno)protein [Microbacterium marinilacus]
MSTAIIDPTASARADAAQAAAGDATVSSVTGLRVGLLENTKRNAAQILDAVGDALVSGHGAGSLVRRTKPQFAMPLSEEQIEDLVAACDAVVVGVGDCGSCSAAAVADGIALQRAGVPVAVICTEAFAQTSRAMASLQGDASFPFLTTEHPVANLAAGEISGRAGGIADDVVRALTGAAR